MEANAQQAVNELGMEASLEKVTDINDIMAYGVMMTPALVIDEKVVAAGKVLSPEKIKKLLG
jgi:small redox-active disulfide protein 2